MTRPADNPFRHELVTHLDYILTGTTWPAMVQRLAALNHRAAIVGPYGSGKTCLLRALGARLKAQGFVLKSLRLSEENRAFPIGFVETFCAQLTPQDYLLFDEADQLSPRAWRDFERRTRIAQGLLITAHRRGRLPTLIRCKPGAAVLSRIVVRLVGDEIPDHARTITRLHRKHRGNLRAALSDLYDLWAEKD